MEADTGGGASMALVAYATVVLVPLGLLGLLAVTAWLERWLPPPDRVRPERRQGI